MNNALPEVDRQSCRVSRSGEVEIYLIELRRWKIRMIDLRNRMFHYLHRWANPLAVVLPGRCAMERVDLIFQPVLGMVPAMPDELAEHVPAEASIRPGFVKELDAVNIQNRQNTLDVLPDGRFIVRSRNQG